MAGTDPVLADPNPRHLEWDTKFFNKKVSAYDLSAPRDNCRIDVNKEDLLYLSVDVEDAWHGSHPMTTLEYLAQTRPSTYLVEVKVVLESSQSAPIGMFNYPIEDSLLLIPAKGYDLSKFYNSFGHSRFYKDPRLRLYAPLLYKIWIESVIDESYVAVSRGGVDHDPKGFISVKKNNIDLIAVAEKYRGQGVGRFLIRNAIVRNTGVAFKRYTVSTQASNTSALKLYKKYGFEVAKTKLRYHSWK